MERARNPMKDIDATIAAEAVMIVNGDRRAAYDHPAVNFARIAALWSPIFGVEVTPRQVALAMIQVKVAREIHCPKRDNLVDICGYVLTLDAVQ